MARRAGRRILRASARARRCLNPAVELDVTPEPEPDELEAIVAALGDEPQPEESPWWRAGLPDGDDDSY
jgi:hypothetical protein